jgi:RNA polymerase sigma-B factor
MFSILNTNSIVKSFRNALRMVTIEFREKGACLAAQPVAEIRPQRALPPRAVRPSRGRQWASRAVSRPNAHRSHQPSDAARKLLCAYHQRGDLEARDQLIRQYLPLVRSLARRYAGRGEDLEDLVQVGSIGLIKAIDRFKPERGLDLGAFAIPTIVGEIKRHLRDKAFPIRVPRRLQELNVQLRACAAELSADLERPGTVAELAKSADVRPDEAVEALACERSQKPLSLSAAINRDGEVDALERTGGVDGGYELGEDRVLLARGLRVLDERERRLIHLGFFEGLSQAQIARRVGISQIHVSRLTRRALQKLRAEIGDTAPRCAESSCS